MTKKGFSTSRFKFSAVILLFLVSPSLSLLSQSPGQRNLRKFQGNNRKLASTKETMHIEHHDLEDQTHDVSDTTSANTCCDKCADDEACKIDKNGCECWKPASSASPSSSNYAFLKYKTNVFAPHGIYNDGKTSSGSSQLEQAEDDCCDKCADDEACKVDKNGCECWKAVSALLSPQFSSSSSDFLKLDDLIFKSVESVRENFLGCCVGTDSSARVARECAAFTFDECSNGHARGSNGETCYWNADLVCPPMDNDQNEDDAENEEGCCIATDPSERVQRECSLFTEQECKNGNAQGANGETCYWSSEAVCPSEQEKNTQFSGESNSDIHSQAALSASCLSVASALFVVFRNVL